MASDCTVACGCRRTFLSKAALEQHRRDKTPSASASVVSNRWANIKVSRVPDSVPRKSSKGPEIRDFKDVWLAKGAGNVVDTLTSASLKLSSSEPPISNNDHYDLICSYNWVNKKTPEVYVPGGAPIFKAISLPMTIKPDSCRHFIEQKAMKLPDYPFEVVFQAAELMNPTVRFDEIDVLTNRNSLLKFFDFCEGRVQKSFRVNLHLVNDTLIIERCVRSTAEYFPGSGASGFGHNFEKVATRLPRGLENSSGHHRVLRYDFGRLKCAVCFEVDSTYGDPETVRESETYIPKAKSYGEESKSLATAFSSIAVDKAGSESTGGSADTIPRGAGTDQASVAELKSRQDNRSNPKPGWFPQLWLGRTRYLITGHHENGTFDDVRVQDLREELEAWEKNELNQETLQKMAVLLSRLRDTVRATEAKSCVALCEKTVRPYTLRIHASTSGKGPLPDSVVEKFWNKRTN
ncbi:hypothetical protein INS49_002399 [Diaporthe citri]|uniref:uncharacterized protein n=1 Tax=Diaporthe citri TaxID=83186 RepID=UPI001C81E414|nr:uncharacterized protein INS49_002399 [Diaporthe citri]KAG6368198.1 hypothetical protein INS49_002399 [Diaporthe citri]